MKHKAVHPGLLDEHRSSLTITNLLLRWKMETKIHFVGRCPICGQGDVIIVKEKSSNSLSLICDDCESQWEDPETLLSGGNPLQVEKNNLDDAITEDEIKLAGWGRYKKSYL